MLKFPPATASASAIEYTSDLWIQTNPFSARLLLFGILLQQQDARTEGGHFGDCVTGGTARAVERKLVKRSRRLGRPHTCITLAPALFSPFPSLTATWPVLCSIVCLPPCRMKVSRRQVCGLIVHGFLPQASSW